LSSQETDTHRWDPVSSFPFGAVSSILPICFPLSNRPTSDHISALFPPSYRSVSLCRIDRLRITSRPPTSIQQPKSKTPETCYWEGSRRPRRLLASRTRAGARTYITPSPDHAGTFRAETPKISGASHSRDSAWKVTPTSHDTVTRDVSPPGRSVSISTLGHRRLFRLGHETSRPSRAGPSRTLKEVSSCPAPRYRDVRLVWTRRVTTEVGAFHGSR
jgi:hypothetical protein